SRSSPPSRSAPNISSSWPHSRGWRRIRRRWMRSPTLRRRKRFWRSCAERQGQAESLSIYCLLQRQPVRIFLVREQISEARPAHHRREHLFVILARQRHDDHLAHHVAAHLSLFALQQRVDILEEFQLQDLLTPQLFSRLGLRGEEAAPFEGEHDALLRRVDEVQHF